MVRRARFPQVLQLPRLLLAGLDVRPRPDPGEAAQRPEASVWARPPPRKTGASGSGQSSRRTRACGGSSSPGSRPKNEKSLAAVQLQAGLEGPARLRLEALEQRAPAGAQERLGRTHA